MTKLVTRFHILQEIINTVVQFAAVMIIAGLFFLFAGKKRGKFLKFVGLIKPTKKAMIWALIATAVFLPLTIALFYLTPLKEAATGENSVAGMIKAQGLSANTLAIAAIVAIFKTSFTEEILFRGVIAKRLIHWLGFNIGNLLHASLFGAIHLLIFIVPGGPEFSWFIASAFFMVPALGGWVKAWLNERIGNGSIAPGWFVHGLTNLVAYPLLAFA